MLKWLSSTVKSFIRSRGAATTVEYGLLIAMLSLVAVAAVIGAAEVLNGTFEKVRDEMANGGIPSK